MKKNFKKKKTKSLHGKVLETNNKDNYKTKNGANFLAEFATSSQQNFLKKKIKRRWGKDRYKEEEVCN